VTVVLALSCVEGVLIATDSQATEADQTRFAVPKVFRLTDSIIWAGSGLSSAILDLKASFDAAKNHFESAVNIDVPLRKYAKTVLLKHYDGYVMVPGKQNMPPSTSLVMAGVSGPDNRPWIAEVSDQCIVSDYSQRGIHAIGSGSSMAQMAAALTAHYDLLGKPLEYAKLVAYRSLNAVIETSAYGVGHPIQMMTVTAKGCETISDDELRALRDRVGGWQQMEVEVLETLMSGESPSPPAGLPEEMDS
jgi:proteasome beta subunit